ncbi:MAG: outer membrane protein, partial [Legionellaceae bacterium]
MKKKWISKVFICLFCLMSHPVLAEEQIVATLSGGPAWYQAGKTQTFYLQPGFKNSYIAQTPTQVLAEGELFLGLQRALSSTLLGQLGLTFAGSSDARLQGSLWETGDPAFDNFTYQYYISHMHVGLKGKLLAPITSTSYVPYVSGSLGVGYNHAFDFTMTPLLFETIPEPPFNNHTQTTLTYTLGAGFQKILNQHWQVGAGYEFADWGKSQLSRAQGQTLNQGLVLNHLYTNQLQLNVSY